ncbi:MAG: hypothetical protein KKC30_12450 [Proteobacteria bacterium]|nr:hypothetical protein [Pseudomonadota bacterium]MBU4384516.1 hypothetical protein [Pseudomonadota bacterium]MBU4604118.1 hypothetical protein [Pseudomonadota bacterium]MCG2766336.1 hypothetical protein [Desulfarculaceae bacterium]
MNTVESDDERIKAERKDEAPHKRPAGPAPNGWSVLLEVIQLASHLLRTGNIIGLMIGLLAFCIAIFAWKASPSTADTVIISSIGFLYSEKFYLIPLLSVLALAVVMCMYRDKVQKGEIKRLARIRKELIHGLESGEFKPFPEHVSSNYDLGD